MFSPRPTARNLARYGTETQDTFGYNTRSELTSAHVNSADYSYTYDAIGNRTVATEAGTRTAYTANKLNQYTAEGAFKPTFDADGNQTLIRTSTGIWNVTYNAKNRPVRFEKTDSSIVVECTYDTMGRRATKKVTTNGTLTEYRRFLYRGYLQIACCDLTRAYTPALWFITWDPTQETATRPLAIQKNGAWYTYGWDLTKNICGTYRTDGRIDLAYTYTPYGEVSPAHAYDQPIRWSSEYHDVELGLVYYNYRHYNPAMGRWMGRDVIRRVSGDSLYHFSKNAVVFLTDYLGAEVASDMTYGLSLFHYLKNIDNQTYTANPQEGYNICKRYTQNSASTCLQGDKCEMDSYPQKAKNACDGFISMYTKNGKLRNAVLCVAKCLTEAEDVNRNVICCNARNTARLFSHFSCYIKCGFVMDLFSKNNFGVPEGGWEIGLTLLLPDVISYTGDVFASNFGKEGKKYNNSIKMIPQNVKYTNPFIFK